MDYNNNSLAIQQGMPQNALARPYYGMDKPQRPQINYEDTPENSSNYLALQQMLRYNQGAPSIEPYRNLMPRPPMQFDREPMELDPTPPLAKFFGYKVPPKDWDMYRNPETLEKRRRFFDLIDSMSPRVPDALRSHWFWNRPDLR